jgi:hypothetical protein
MKINNTGQTNHDRQEALMVSAPTRNWQLGKRPVYVSVRQTTSNHRRKNEYIAGLNCCLNGFEILNE